MRLISAYPVEKTMCGSDYQHTFLTDNLSQSLVSSYGDLHLSLIPAAYFGFSVTATI